jgi:hypothetical protein
MTRSVKAPSAFHERMTAKGKTLDFPLLLPDKDAPRPMVLPDLTGGRRNDAFKDVTDSWCAEQGFIHDQRAPDEWVVRLRDVSPRDDEVDWLAFAWEAGDPWVPLQRWGLYGMVHIKHILGDLDDDELDSRIEELRGPHPRSEGHLCSHKVPGQFQCLCQRKMEAWRGGPCNLITLTQWKLFREYDGQYLPVPFWVIEGERGGHKWLFNEEERTLLRMSDLPDEPPTPGSLPYAPFDNRVIEQIMRHNKLLQFGCTIAELKKKMGSDAYARHKADNAREMRKKYLAYLEDQLVEENDLFITAARKGEMNNQRTTDVDYVKLGELADAHYVETGEILHPSQIQ